MKICSWCLILRARGDCGGWKAWMRPENNLNLSKQSTFRDGGLSSVQARASMGRPGSFPELDPWTCRCQATAKPLVCCSSLCFFSAVGPALPVAWMQTACVRAQPQRSLPVRSAHNKVAPATSGACPGACQARASACPCSRTAFIVFADPDDQTAKQHSFSQIPMMKQPI